MSQEARARNAVPSEDLRDELGIDRGCRSIKQADNRPESFINHRLKAGKGTLAFNFIGRGIFRKFIRNVREKWGGVEENDCNIEGNEGKNGEEEGRRDNEGVSRIKLFVLS